MGDESKNISIYAIHCNSTGRVYIGMSKQVEERIRQHLQDLRLGHHNNKQLRDDYKTYGADDFTFFVLEEGLSESEARQREQDYMDEYNTRNPKFGYNSAHPRWGRNTIAAQTKPHLIYGKPPKTTIGGQA